MSSIDIFYVYVHKTLNNEPFYVGKGKGKRAHSKVGRGTLWKEVAQDGFTVEIIYDNLSEDIAFQREVETIALLRKEGKTLCNQTNGGEGRSGAIFTNETRQLMTQNNYIKWQNPSYRELMINTSRKLWESAEHKKNISDKTRESWKDLEVRNRRLAKQQDPKFMEERSTRHKLRAQTPENKEAISKRFKALWLDQAFQEKMAKRKTNGRKIYCPTNGETYPSASSAARALDISHTTILHIAKGIRTKTKSGYSFIFVD